MTTLTLAGLTYFLPSSGSGISVEGLKVRRQSIDIWKQLRESFELSSRDTLIGAKLEHAQAQAALPNWDGYGAAPVNAMSIEYAKRFLLLLPPASPMPEVEVDPDGEISFDWFGPNKSELTISFSPLGMISYSVLFGEVGYDHGQKLFEDEIPKDLIQKIKEVCSTPSPRR